MERGELVPMEVVLDLLKEAILKNLPNSSGFLIDGYPREKEQGILFEKKIASVNLVLFFDASEKTLVDRLLGRAKTSGRVDDNEETIKKRLHTFNTHNDQVVQQYTEKLKKVSWYIIIITFVWTSISCRSMQKDQQMKFLLKYKLIWIP